MINKFSQNSLQGRLRVQSTRIWLEKIIILFFIQALASGLEWNSSVTIPNVQYSNFNSYNISSSSLVLQVGELASDDSIFYGGSIDSVDSVFNKENSNKTIEWSKRYSSFIFYHQAFVLRNDEESIYVIQEGVSTAVNIITINATDGSLQAHISE